MFPLVPAAAYADGTGLFENTDTPPDVDTQFAFDGNANSVPAILASESTHVVDCVTAYIVFLLIY